MIIWLVEHHGTTGEIATKIQRQLHNNILRLRHRSPLLSSCLLHGPCLILLSQIPWSASRTILAPPRTYLRALRDHLGLLGPPFMARDLLTRFPQDAKASTSLSVLSGFPIHVAELLSSMYLSTLWTVAKESACNRVVERCLERAALRILGRPARIHQIKDKYDNFESEDNFPLFDLDAELIPLDLGDAPTSEAISYVRGRDLPKTHNILRDHQRVSVLPA